MARPPLIKHEEPEPTSPWLIRFSPPATSRLPHIPSDETRHMVMVMRANGMSIAAVADCLSIAIPTVERHYKIELKNGFDRVKSHIGAAVVNAALAGNLSAMKYWLAVHCPEWRLPKGALGEPEERGDDDSPVVKFYLPSNGRDGPDEDEGVTIEGVVEKAA